MTYENGGVSIIRMRKMIKRKCGFCKKKLERKHAGKKYSFCNLRCKAEFQRLAKPVTKDWLYKKYIVEKLTANDIAKIVKRDPKSVWNWLKDFGIPTRRRGSYEPNWFKKGHKLRVGMKASDETREKIRQARLREGRVPYLKNGVHCFKGKRGPEVPWWKGGSTPERQKFYATAEWIKISKQVKKRDKRMCQRCRITSIEAKDAGMKMNIHHIESFMNKEKRAKLDNLVLLCRKCHLFVHSKENTNKEFLK